MCASQPPADLGLTPPPPPTAPVSMDTRYPHSNPGGPSHTLAAASQACRLVGGHRGDRHCEAPDPCQRHASASKELATFGREGERPSPLCCYQVCEIPCSLLETVEAQHRVMRVVSRPAFSHPMSRNPVLYLSPFLGKVFPESPQHAPNPGSPLLPPATWQSPIVAQP